MSRVFGRVLQIAAVAAVLSGGPMLAASPTGQANPASPTLQDRVAFGLETSSVVRKYDVHVKVVGKQTILTGTVATEAQRAEAVRLAKVAGATDIKNEITVDKSIDTTLADRVKAGLAKTGDAISDTWITTKVKWFFWTDDRLKGSHIDVTTTDHVVTLKGTVPAAAARTRAVSLATSTEGVRKVVDQMTIGSK